MTVYEGELTARGVKIAIAVSRFNDFITGKLLEGALAAVKRHGGDVDATPVVWTPGAFELPLVCDRLAGAGFARDYPRVLRGRDSTPSSPSAP